MSTDSDEAAVRDRLGIRSKLSIAREAALIDTRGRLDSTGSASMFHGWGALDASELRTLCTVYAWAEAHEETSSAVREDLASSLYSLCSYPPVSPPLAALALIAARSHPLKDPDADEYLRTELEAALSAAHHSIDTYLRTPGFVRFSAPYWLSVSAGLTCSVPEPFHARRRRHWFSPPADDPRTRQRENALRTRYEARRTLRYLLAQNLVDTTSQFAVTTMLDWSIMAQPAAPDVPEIRELLEQLQAADIDDER